MVRRRRRSGKQTTHRTKQLSIGTSISIRIYVYPVRELIWVYFYDPSCTGEHSTFVAFGGSTLFISAIRLAASLPMADARRAKVLVSLYIAQHFNPENVTK